VSAHCAATRWARADIPGVPPLFRDLVEFAVQAEQVGLDSVLISDH
jgi:hypothetical protein